MDEVDVQRVLKETNILSVVNNCLSIQDDIHPIIRYIKLEATWILTNIGYGNEEDIMEIFGDEYKFIDHINRILKGNDLQMIDQVIWLISNMCATSSNLRNKIVSEVFIVETINKIISQAIECKASLRTNFIGNIIWCLQNLLRTSTVPQPNGQMENKQFLTTDELTQIHFVLTTLMDSEIIRNLNIQDILICFEYLLVIDDEQITDQVC